MSDELSDVDNKIYEKYRGNNTDCNMVMGKYGGNDVVHSNREKDTKWFREVQELSKVALSSDTIDNDETQRK